MSRISGGSLGTYTPAQAYTAKNEKKDTATDAPLTPRADRLEKSASFDAGIYSPASFEKTAGQSSVVPKERIQSDQKILNSAIEQSKTTISRFKEMVASMLNQQTEYHAGKAFSPASVGLTASGVPNDGAAGPVGQDDYFGADATADRIFNFAVSLSGGDPKAMEMLKGVVQKTFKECEKLFGGKLPDISYQTLDKINSLFCDYEKQAESPVKE